MAGIETKLCGCTAQPRSMLQKPFAGVSGPEDKHKASPPIATALRDFWQTHIGQGCGWVGGRSGRRHSGDASAPPLCKDGHAEGPPHGKLLAPLGVCPELLALGSNATMYFSTSPHSHSPRAPNPVLLVSRIPSKCCSNNTAEAEPMGGLTVVRIQGPLCPCMWSSGGGGASIGAGPKSRVACRNRHEQPPLSGATEPTAPRNAPPPRTHPPTAHVQAHRQGSWPGPRAYQCAMVAYPPPPPPAAPANPTPL